VGGIEIPKVEANNASSNPKARDKRGEARFLPSLSNPHATHFSLQFHYKSPFPLTAFSHSHSHSHSHPLPLPNPNPQLPHLRGPKRQILPLEFLLPKPFPSSTSNLSTTAEMESLSSWSARFLPTQLRGPVPKGMKACFVQVGLAARRFVGVGSGGGGDGGGIGLCGDGRLQPAIGTERIWLREVSRIAKDGVHRNTNMCSFWYMTPLDLQSPRGATRCSMPAPGGLRRRDSLITASEAVKVWHLPLKCDTSSAVNAVINESLRLNPPGAGIEQRVAPRGGLEVKGCHIPEGTHVGVPMYTILRDPRTSLSQIRSVPIAGWSLPSPHKPIPLHPHLRRYQPRRSDGRQTNLYKTSLHTLRDWPAKLRR